MNTCHLKLPRLTREHIWDPEMILDFYRKEPENNELNFMDLSYKTAVLLLLATGKHPSEIRNMDLDHYSVFPNRITFTNPAFTKTL